MIDYLTNSPYFIVLQLICVLYVAHIIGLMVNLKKIGIVPRTARGLLGILFTPWIHNNWKHLFANTLPLLVLLSLLKMFFATQFLSVLLLTTLLSGSILWLIGRKASHIGASGVIYGFITFLGLAGWFTKTFATIAISIGVLLVYGGFIWGTLPLVKKSTSWEGHLAGVFAGGITAFLIFKNLVPLSL